MSEEVDFESPKELDPNEPLLPPDNHKRASPGYKRVAMKPWHEALSEYLILNPSATRAQAAEHFGVQPLTVILVCGSDMFKYYHAQRMKTFQNKVDQVAMARLEGKVANLANEAVDLLREKIEIERTVLGIDATRETAEMALKALGFGVRAQGPAVVNNTIHVTSEDLAAARALMPGSQPKAIEDGEFKALPAAQ